MQVRNFSLNWQFWLFYICPEREFPVENRKIALVHASMVVTYYIKHFRTGADRHNRILMSLLLLVAEAINYSPNNWIFNRFYSCLITRCSLLRVKKLFSKCTWSTDSCKDPQHLTIRNSRNLKKKLSQNQILHNDRSALLPKNCSFLSF